MQLHRGSAGTLTCSTARRLQFFTGTIWRSYGWRPAGTLSGGVGNVAGWIANAQHLKPGNAMQSYDQLEGPELRALAACLESLK